MTVETLAAILHEAIYGPQRPTNAPTWEQLSEHHRRIYRRQAEAAIQALTPGLFGGVA